MTNRETIKVLKDLKKAVKNHERGDMLDSEVEAIDNAIKTLNDMGKIKKMYVDNYSLNGLLCTLADIFDC